MKLGYEYSRLLLSIYRGDIIIYLIIRFTYLEVILKRLKE